MTRIAEELAAYLEKTYHVSPETPWARHPGCTAFRHRESRRLFALVATVPERRLGRNGAGWVEILNFKVSDPFLSDHLILEEGFFRGIPIGREGWVSVILDGRLPLETLCRWLDESYAATSQATRQKNRPPRAWVVPANPKYYDVQAAFDASDEIRWKQGRGIRTGDTVFLYLAAPVSAILYQCRVTETDIPYRFAKGAVHMSHVMNIQLVKRYDPTQFTRTVLGEEYGVYAVRGPRGIPDRLLAALQ